MEKATIQTPAGITLLAHTSLQLFNTSQRSADKSNAFKISPFNNFRIPYKVTGSPTLGVMIVHLPTVETGSK